MRHLGQAGRWQGSTARHLAGACLAAFVGLAALSFAPAYAQTSAILSATAGSVAVPAPAPGTDAEGFPLPDGALARFGSAKLRELATGNRLSFPLGANVATRPLLFSRSGRALQLWAGCLLTVDWQTGRPLHRIELSLPRGDIARHIAVAANGSRVAGIAGGKKCIVWDAETGREVAALQERWFRQDSVLLSGDGKTVYTSSLFDGLKAWNADTGTALKDFAENLHAGRQLVISADGRWLSTAPELPALPGAHDGAITVWDADTGRVVRDTLWPLIGADIAAVAFSPDGESLVAVGHIPSWRSPAGPGLIELWNIRTGEETLIRNGLPHSLTCVAFSPDGRTLVTGDNGQTVRLWELATGRERHCFSDHGSPVYNVIFSPDGKLVASGGPDAPVFVWDVEGNYDKQPSGAAFTEDEKTKLWKALDDADAATAFRTMRLLLARPGPAVTLLREKLRPAASVDEKVVQTLLQRLQSAPADALDKANSDLAAIIDAAEPLVRKSLTEARSAEKRRRILCVLESAGTDMPGRRRQVRAVEVAEHLATPEARELLKHLASGADGVLLTREARAALARLAAR